MKRGGRQAPVSQCAAPVAANASWRYGVARKRLHPVSRRVPCRTHMALRIGLLDETEGDEWSSRPNRFEGLAVALTAEGHTAVLVGGRRTAVATRPSIVHLPDDPPPHPLLTGLNHALETAPLTRSHDLVRRIAGSRLDLVIAPLRGGIAHGLLMARSCG